jgi:sulfite exporter TauE/SafE
MIGMGLAYALEWRAPARWSAFWHDSTACRSLAQIWRSPSLLKSVLAGWLNGFLPCGLSLMAILYLVGTNSAATVVVGAYAFGFSTLPGLFAVGYLGQRFSLGRRRLLVRVGGVALIALGLLTLIRGDPRIHGWFHDHLMFGDDPAMIEHHGH